MKSTFITAFILATAGLVFGQSDLGVYTTVPTTSQVVNAGNPLNITWTYTNPFTNTTDASNTNATLISTIELRKGDAANLELVLPNLLTNGSIEATELVYTWDIPTNLTTNNTYALIYIGYDGLRSYSSFFTIQANTTAVSNTTDTVAATTTVLTTACACTTA